MPLITTPNLEAGDDFYEALLDAHQALDPAASQAFNARLILLLANHVGRQDVLLEALAAAARGAAPSPASATPADTSATPPAAPATHAAATNTDPAATAATSAGARADALPRPRGHA